MIAEKEYMDQLAGSPGISPNKRFIDEKMKSQFAKQNAIDRVPSPIERMEAAVMELYRASERVCSLEVSLVGCSPEDASENSNRRVPSEDVFGRIEEAADRIIASTANIVGALSRIEKRI